jgi:hypothetical protein
MLEVLRGVESDDPEADHERAHGENPFTDGAVVNGEGGGLAHAEDLAPEADGHEDDAERESEPGESHGLSFYPNQHRCGKREVRAGGKEELKAARAGRTFGAELKNRKDLDRDFKDRQKRQKL